MAVDAERKRVLVAFRRPTRFVVFDEESGREVTDAETCGAFGLARQRRRRRQAGFVDAETAKYWTDGASVFTYALAYVKARTTGESPDAEDIARTGAVRF